MSRINGEKARAALMKKRRTAQRVKDRARVEEIKNAGNAAAKPQQQSQKSSD